MVLLLSLLPPKAMSEISSSSLEERLLTFSSWNRIPGYPGFKEAASYVEEELRQMGVGEVSVQDFNLAVPIDEGATLALEEEEYPIYPLWPNLLRSSNLPPQGERLELIFAGQGTLEELEGKSIEGKALLLDLNSRDRWIELAGLGAKAFLFYGSGKITKEEAEKKFVSVPLNIPRFWLPNETRDKILRRAQRGVEVLLKCRMRWRNVTGKNILGIIPGADPELSKDVVIISSYYDSISFIPSLSPGAESSCGVSVLLELAGQLMRKPPKRTVLFLTTSGHFQGMRGISYFIRALHLLRKDGKLPEELDPEGKEAQQIKEFMGKYFDEDMRIFFVGLDLSSNGRRIGAFHRGGFIEERDLHRGRRYLPLGRSLAAESKRIASKYESSWEELYADGVASSQGKGMDSFFKSRIPFESEVANLFIPGITFATTDDERRWVSTHHDTLKNLNIEGLTKQANFLLCLLRFLIDDEDLFLGIKEKERVHGPIFGRAVEFDRMESIVPDKPIPGAVLALIPACGWNGEFLRSDVKPIFGVRTSAISLAGEEGRFEFLSYLWPGELHLEAFLFDEESGEMTYAPDLGNDGDARYNFRHFKVDARGGVEINYVLFPCASLSLSGFFDPRHLLTLRRIDIYDAGTDNVPQFYGFILPLTTRRDTSYVEPCLMVFGPQGSRLKLTMSLGLIGRSLVLINASPESPEGDGIVMEEEKTLPFLMEKVASDLWQLNEYRRKILSRYGIRSDRLEALHELARTSIQKAAQERKERNWRRYRLEADRAWSYSSRVYPDISSTANDVVRGALFFLAMTIPFAFFSERLLLGSTNIYKRLGGTVAIFSLVLLLLILFHPAFGITLTPFLIFLAFVILVLGGLVSMVIMGKLGRELQSLRGGMVGVSRTDVNRAGALLSAFNLGMSNMRKRWVRTTLTCLTIMVMTFCILSFTTLRTSVRFNVYPLPWKSTYDGILYRNISWTPLENAELTRLREELGDRFYVAPRSWLISPRHDEYFVADVLNETTGAQGSVEALVGLSLKEREITGVEETIVGGRWFKIGERDVCILPDGMASFLGIDSSLLDQAWVKVLGFRLKVIGIFSSDKFNQIRDLDRGLLTPVSFLFKRPIHFARGEETDPRSAAMEEYIHFDSSSILILPFQTLMERGGTMRSIAACPRVELDLEEALEEVMMRLSIITYAGVGSRTFLYSSMRASSLSGLGILALPLVIGALIIFNTMLGSVYERQGEISTYCSVGLSPMHVFSFFLAECCVYAVVGSTLGYLIGQVVARLITLRNLLPGLTLNYSSSSSIASILLVTGITLLSSIYPASRAFRLAVPDIERRWQVGEPLGDKWIFDLPFLVLDKDAPTCIAFLHEFLGMHTEEAVGRFYVSNLRSHRDGGRLVIEFNCWLAPYDFGVSQNVRLETVKSDVPGNSTFRLTLMRISGDVASWKRMVRGFLDILRKQLLAWRTISPEDRLHYREIAKDLGIDIL